MLNVNQITSTLAKLPDAALQKYAAMNKNDPYIMALAVAESNRRKEMRAGAQMQAPQQPKVVDQAVQGMAAPMPEDTGIAQIPAGDMNFADGGIVAFDEGGLAKDNPAAMAVLAPLQAAVQSAKNMYEAAAKSGDQRAAQMYLQNLSDAQQKLAAASQQQFAGSAAQGITAAQQASAPQPQAAQTGTPPVPGADKGIAAAAPKVDTAGAGVGTPAVAGARGATDYASAKAGLADLYKTPDMAEYEGARKAQAGAGVGIAQEAAGRTQDFYDKLGEFGLKQEERLKAREGKLEEDTAKGKGLAILEAGLAMMSGTSANAFENIGKGALAGVANYKKGLAELNARRDRLDDAYNQLDTARYSDKKDRFAQIEAAQKNVDNAKLGIYQATTDIAAKKTDLNAKQSTALADAVVKSVEGERDRQSRESAAGATGNLALYKAIGGGDPKEGLRIATEIQAGKFSVQDAYAKYLTALSGKTTLEKPMDFASFASQFAFSAPPAGGPVRQLK